MRKLTIAAVALALAGFAGSASAQMVVSSDVTTDTTWSGTVVLQQPIFVRNGATLTVLPGTVVRGQPRTQAPVSGVTAGTPGALIVTQTGRIVANGSSNNPIIFTTAVPDKNGDNVPDDSDGNGFFDLWTSGDAFYDDTPATAPLAPLAANGQENVSLWGGVVLNGSAPTNLANVASPSGFPYGTQTIEGLTFPGFPASSAVYGGLNPHDSSGSLQFVSIRHAGDPIDDANELNCLSLGAVGDGTIIDHVECYCNFDDGFEMFGGTVNAQHLAAIYIGDDSLDVDQGYTGVVQFAFVAMPFFDEGLPGGVAQSAYGSGSGDKAGEWDGDDFDETAPGNLNKRVRWDEGAVDDTPFPLQYPNFYNVTVIGSTPDGANPAPFPAADNTGIQMRNGFAGELHNSIIVNTGSGAGLDIGGGGAPGFSVPNNIANDRVAVGCTSFADVGSFSSDANDALANGGNNTTSGFQGLENENTSINPRGNAANKLSSNLKAARIDPRPRLGFGNPGTGGCPSPQGPDLDSGATYTGAFDPTGPLWTKGWTVFSISGLIDDDDVE